VTDLATSPPHDLISVTRTLRVTENAPVMQKTKPMCADHIMMIIMQNDHIKNVTQNQIKL